MGLFCLQFNFCFHNYLYRHRHDVDLTWANLPSRVMKLPDQRHRIFSIWWYGGHLSKVS